MQQTVKKIGSGLFIGLVLLLAFLFGGVRLIGLTPYAVLSGSMEPAYPTGSLLLVQKKAATDICAGEVITFTLQTSGQAATHRVIRVDRANGCFYTKGDANQDPDAQPVSFDRLIGQPVLDVPYLGYAASFLMRAPVRLGLLGVALVAVLLTLLRAGLQRQQINAAAETGADSAADTAVSPVDGEAASRGRTPIRPHPMRRRGLRHIPSARAASAGAEVSPAEAPRRAGSRKQPAIRGQPP